MNKAINPMLLCDFYKTVHSDMINPKMTKSMSYYTPRMSRVKRWDKVVMFGVQMFCKTWLIDYFNENFDGNYDESCQYYNGREEVSNQDFLGIVTDYNEETKIALIEQRNYFKVGDTIEISNGINKGLHTVSTVSGTITTDTELFDSVDNLITKIEYPLEVIEGAIDILDWELVKKGKEKSGIASETISRHSVSYVQRTGDNTINGYPVELFNFCDEYKKARF